MRTLRRRFQLFLGLVLGALLFAACGGELDVDFRLEMTLVNESQDRQLFVVRSADTEEVALERGFSPVGVDSERDFNLGGPDFDGVGGCLDELVWIFVGPPGFEIQEEFERVPNDNLGESVPGVELWMVLDETTCSQDRNFEIVFG